MVHRLEGGADTMNRTSIKILEGSCVIHYTISAKLEERTGIEPEAFRLVAVSNRTLSPSSFTFLKLEEDNGVEPSPLLTMGQFSRLITYH